MRVRLCGVFELVPLVSRDVRWEGCSSEDITRTDAKGSYAFGKVTTGSYVVLAEQSGKWSYMTSYGRGKRHSKVRVDGADFETARYKVTPNSTVVAETSILVKDMVLVHPISGDVESAHPVLTWKSFPEASRYSVSLTQWQKSSRFPPMWAGDIFFMRVTRENRLKVAESLKNCFYRWNVSAHNAKGTEIANSSSTDAQFTVKGQRKCQ